MVRGSSRAGAIAGGTPVAAPCTAFNKAQGAIGCNGAAIAQVTVARLTYANGMEMVRTIRADRRIEGVAPGIARCTGPAAARFADTRLLTQAENGTAAEFACAYTIDVNRGLTVTLHDVCLALAKTPVGWPVVVEASIDVRNAFNATATPMTTAVLRSQRASGNSA